MAENQGQTIATPVNNNQPAASQNDAQQQNAPMWASPQPSQTEHPQTHTQTQAQPVAPGQFDQTGTAPAGAFQPNPAFGQQPAGLPAGSGVVQQPVQPHGQPGPYATNQPPLTFEVPQEQLAGAPAAPAAGGNASGGFAEKLKTPMAAAIIGGVLLLGVGFATGYVVGHDQGSSSTSSSDSQTGFGGGMGGFPGGQGQGGTGQGQGGTGTNPFGQSQGGTGTGQGQSGTGTNPFSQGQGQSGTGQSQDGTTGQSQGGTTTEDGSDLTQTQ
ncbi:hypothetical protein KIH74_01190 [Kineosporia sp. J2-2]|uniref:Uncharacterized protein n=1 Tax=Kineosporia corallincola TaxID=2835133 RepID=A0ABS5T8X3_9ACTN|nr:hypothetical protein [Kineosporia corallincola]MBT0767517.1 hypothetical protein [Kineosporia corallincola]